MSLQPFCDTWVSKSFLLRWHRQIQNSFGYMDKILHNGRCLLPNWHIGHHVNLTCYRLWSSIATAKQVLHVFDHHQSEKTMSEAVWAQEVGQNPQEVLSLRHFLPPHYHFRHLLQLFLHLHTSVQGKKGRHSSDSSPPCCEGEEGSQSEILKTLP